MSSFPASLLLLSSFLQIINSDVKCPSTSPPYQVSCTDHAILYMFDETISFDVDEFSNEVRFFRQWLFPTTDWAVNPAVGPNKYLADFSQKDAVTEENDVCWLLEQLEQRRSSNVGSPSNNLLVMVQKSIDWASAISNQTTIVLFSSSQNTTEIKEASKYARNNNKQATFVVIALAGADFSSFPAKVLNVENLGCPDYCLAYVTQQVACGNDRACRKCPCPVQFGNCSSTTGANGQTTVGFTGSLLTIKSTPLITSTSSTNRPSNGTNRTPSKETTTPSTSKPTSSASFTSTTTPSTLTSTVPSPTETHTQTPSTPTSSSTTQTTSSRGTSTEATVTATISKASSAFANTQSLSTHTVTLPEGTPTSSSHTSTMETTSTFTPTTPAQPVTAPTPSAAAVTPASSATPSPSMETIITSTVPSSTAPETSTVNTWTSVSSAEESSTKTTIPSTTTATIATSASATPPTTETAASSTRPASDSTTTVEEVTKLPDTTSMGTTTAYTTTEISSTTVSTLSSTTDVPSTRTTGLSASTTTAGTSSTGSEASTQETIAPATTTAEPTSTTGTTPTGPSSTPSTISSTISKTTQTTSLTTVAPSVPLFDPRLNPECQCSFESVWNDVVFLFDSSDATGDMGLQEMWVSVQSWLDFFNVQKSGYSQSPNFMQVSVIVYANETRILSNLGDWSLDDVMAQERLPYLGGTSDNLQGGLQQAVDQFARGNRRRNSQMIIVVYTTVYSSLNNLNPQTIASIFKESGGILMIFNYLEMDGSLSPSAELMELASNGYFFTSRDNDNTDLQQAQCDANCHCKPNFYRYLSNPRGYPLAGCYTFTDIQVNFDRAQWLCQSENGTLVADEYQAKTDFYNEYITRDYWIGLIWNETINYWTWTYNGDLLDDSYSPWYGGQTPNGSTGDRVRMGLDDGYWRPVDSDKGLGFSYICVFPPCDSVNYCP